VGESGCFTFIVTNQFNALKYIGKKHQEKKGGKKK
jgi:hypothetical protein